jgi:hypothetical protein
VTAGQASLIYFSKTSNKLRKELLLLTDFIARKAQIATYEFDLTNL